MYLKNLPLFLFLLFSTQFLFSQNYLRVGDPDVWDAPSSLEPNWHEYMDHAQLEEVTIIAEPQGVFTEIGFYATISQGPDAWSWEGDYEIIWQFDLPGHTIVHDSWLWIEQDIIKADVVDYWTALSTYEEIVDRNEDPSFFYQLPDNRFEIRIYPLMEGETRRIKMSFLVPTIWDTESITSSLLQNILQSTDYSPQVIGIGMPVNELWEFPEIRMENVLIPMSDTVTGGAGDLMHFLEIPGTEFVSANNVELLVKAPLSDSDAFLSTYEDGGENYYQLAYVPDWESAAQGQPKRSLILMDFDEYKTTMTIPVLTYYMQSVLVEHFTDSDAVNIAVATSDGLKLLSDNWWTYDADLFADSLEGLLNVQNVNDLEMLLKQGFEWVQNQPDLNRIYLLASNDEFVYPPVAEDVFSNLENLMPIDIPFKIFDYQDENVSVVYYNNEEYHGNDYFYDLLASSFSDSETVVYIESNQPYPDLLTVLFPVLVFPSGIVDFVTTLENGITYQRYSLNSPVLNPENKGVMLQTGKYLGDFPMHIDANLITNDGQYWHTSSAIEPNDVLTGDTLMKEMWYGPHLKELEAQADNDEDRLYIIDQSINERVLTSLTAFLALEPDQGGDPCIDCLFNNGEIIIVSVNENFKASEAQLIVTPNPMSDHAKVLFLYTETLIPEDWKATVFDISGRPVKSLNLAHVSNNALEWQWSIDPEIKAGVYFCKVQSSYGELIAKMIVLPE